MSSFMHALCSMALGGIHCTEPSDCLSRRSRVTRFEVRTTRASLRIDVTKATAHGTPSNSMTEALLNRESTSDILSTTLMTF